MENHTDIIQEIKYKNKTIDCGLIIGTRKYRWCLKQKYEPCWAKNGEYISELSPHKKDFKVYIPLQKLKDNSGHEIRIGDLDEITTIKITGINGIIINYDKIKVEHYEKWKTKRTHSIQKDLVPDDSLVF